MKNECGKARTVENPYEIWKSPDGAWEWRVLKKYQAPDKEVQNPYARWFCAVKSPFTYGSWEYGDTYARDVKQGAILVKKDANVVWPKLPEAKPVEAPKPEPKRKLVKTDATDRIAQAMTGSLPKGQLTLEYLEALRRGLYKWLERVDEAIYLSPETPDQQGDQEDDRNPYFDEYR